MYNKPYVSKYKTTSLYGSLVAVSTNDGIFGPSNVNVSGYVANLTFPLEAESLAVLQDNWTESVADNGYVIWHMYRDNEASLVF